MRRCAGACSSRESRLRQTKPGFPQAASGRWGTGLPLCAGGAGLGSGRAPAVLGSGAGCSLGWRSLLLPVKAHRPVSGDHGTYRGSPQRSSLGGPTVANRRSGRGEPVQGQHRPGVVFGPRDQAVPVPRRSSQHLFSAFSGTSALALSLNTLVRRVSSVRIRQGFILHFTPPGWLKAPAIHPADAELAFREPSAKC